MKKIVIIITGFLFSFIDFQTKAVEISYGTYFNIPAGLNMKFVDVNNDNDLDIISLVSFSQQVLIANNNHGIFSSYVFDVLFGSPD
ncbi:MAG: hypothetical protein R3F23_08635 [Verrucomicrobiia bacterium]